jgi:hypothetical protein
MYSEEAGRARDARLVNGVMNLGGRNASAFEVDQALGLQPRPWKLGSFRKWLAAVGRLSLFGRAARLHSSRARQAAMRRSAGT